MTILRILLISSSLIATAGTLLSLVRSTHWAFRVWDFPRVQVATVAILANTVYALLFSGGSAMETAMLAAGFGTALWQSYRIFPYLRIAPVKVKNADAASDNGGERKFSLLVSNVLMENREHDRLLDVIEKKDPDVILTVETDDGWIRALDGLKQTHPHTMLHPLDNYYGMAIFSRLELIDPQVKFLVQDDIPSLHVRIRLRSGDEVFFHALHPRPPEPIRDQPSAPRDAELVIVGRQIGEDSSRPTVVAGDLNDVAWSPTSELFLRLSGLLDPRLGRGFYNSFNANNPIMRYPLDHVFHSNEFRLVTLQRLESIGSDHFPIYIELLLDPAAPSDQPETEKEAGDEEQADEKLEAQAEAAATGDDRPNDDDRG